MARKSTPAGGNQHHNPLANLAVAAANHPDRAALIGPNLTLSWSGLTRQVQVLAEFFEQQNLEPGAGLLINASPELSRVYSLAALQAGLFSGDLPDQHDAKHLIEIGFRYLLSSKDGFAIDGLQPIGIPVTLGAGAHELEDFEPRPVDSGELLRVVFSSGTTGAPKAIPFTAEILAKRVEAANAHYMKQQPFFNLLSYKTVSGNNAFFLDLFRGTTHLVPGSPAFNAEMLSERGARGLMGSPSALELLVRELEINPRSNLLEVCQSAGGFLNQNLADRAASALGCQIINIYGSTEAGLISFSTPDKDQPFLAGEPYPGVEIEILDSSGNQLPHGQVGRVAVTTPYQVGGYLADPAETETCFIDGKFFSGDLGHIDSPGNLHLSGREDDLINLHGQKINPHPIEAFAVERFGLEEAVCVLATDQTGRQFHIMLVVATKKIDPEAIKAGLFSVYRTSAPQLILQRDNIPKNEMGKVLRRALVQVHS